MSLKNSNVTIKTPKILKNKLDNLRVNRLYNNFEKSLNINESFVVAVSGGPDSLALAFLTKIYSIKKKIRCKYLIVDHKLRKESTQEAKLVKNILRKFSINAEILTWSGKKPNKNIQSIARVKRYDLLVNKCKKLKINNILLGHHQDDLIENFFIRIFRGSGLKGLISLENKNVISNINLLRPLLYQKKQDLIFLSKHVFNFYIKDPSNEDEKFLRIKVRKLIEEFDKNGLGKDKFITTIKNLKYSNNVVNFYAKESLNINSFFSAKDNKIILNNNFFQQPYEIVFRGLSDSIKIIGKKYYSVRGKKLDKIIIKIKKNVFKKGTLGGCIIEKLNQTVIIRKE
mgnify:CR=1 FL=1